MEGISGIRECDRPIAARLRHVCVGMKDDLRASPYSPTYGLGIAPPLMTDHYAEGEWPRGENPAPAGETPDPGAALPCPAIDTPEWTFRKADYGRALTPCIADC